MSAGALTEFPSHGFCFWHPSARTAESFDHLSIRFASFYTGNSIPCLSGVMFPGFFSSYVADSF